MHWRHIVLCEQFLLFARLSVGGAPVRGSLWWRAFQIYLLLFRHRWSSTLTRIDNDDACCAFPIHFTLHHSVSDRIFATPHQQSSTWPEWNWRWIVRAERRPYSNWNKLWMFWMCSTYWLSIVRRILFVCSVYELDRATTTHSDWMTFHTWNYVDPSNMTIWMIRAALFDPIHLRNSYERMRCQILLEIDRIGLRWHVGRRSWWT